MFTVRIDGKEVDVFQFKDLRNGEFFACNGIVFVKCHASIENWNAVNLKKHLSVHVASETIVDPILIEWENEEDVL